MASRKSSPHEPNLGDDPKATIQEILKIVDQLQTNLLPSQILITTSRSSDPELNKPNNRLESVSSAPAILVGQEDSENVIPKLKSNLRLLKEGLIKLQELNKDIRCEVMKHLRPLDYLLKRVEFSKTHLTKLMKKDLGTINKKIFNLMFQVPLLTNKRKQLGSALQDRDGENDGKGIVCLLGIHANEEELKRLEVFKYVKGKLEEFSSTPHLQICLLSFAIFPENQEVNRTMLMYWWIGENILPEELLPPEGGSRRPVKVKTEVTVKKILTELVEKKLIEPVENKRKVEPSCYKMSPFVHSSVILISKEIGLFDMYHRGEKPTLNKSVLKKVCLVEGSSSQTEASARKMASDNIDTVFNVSERFPEFAFKWFAEKQPSHKAHLSKTTYKPLKVFYLGRWERTPERHIEVGNPELMKNLKRMNHLRLLSFQRISRIETLDDAVCELSQLIVLDLRACYNLEKIPDKISWLKKLTHLDMSECYMIDGMPKRLAWLPNLEVLKGFVVSDIYHGIFCRLDELSSLKKLRKLSVSINEKHFGVAELIKAIDKFEKLEKLKVVWGRMSEPPQDIPKTKHGAPASEFLQRTMTSIFFKKPKKRELPKTLRKLDLQCFPDAVLPEWLEPKNLMYLEKLYIKGGTELARLGDSPPEEPTECKVQVLRLKFLHKLKVDWRELSQLYFPELNFLEKYHCPQVSFCPTDGIGIWRKSKYIQN